MGYKTSGPSKRAHNLRVIAKSQQENLRFGGGGSALHYTPSSLPSPVTFELLYFIFLLQMKFLPEHYVELGGTGVQGGVNTNS